MASTESNLHSESREQQGESPEGDDGDLKEKLFKESDYYKRNELPVDRGFAWIICFSGFFLSFNIGLSIQTRGILFLGVIELFDTTLTTASLIFLFSILGVGLMSTFSTNVILPRVGEKAIVCASGLATALASVGYFFSPNIETFLFFATIKGCCIGAYIVPGASLMRHYFHRRRSIAQTVARTGDCLAAITMPPLILVLRNEFGVRGTFLIVGAIELHVVLVGLLLRPVESYKFKPELPPLSNGRKSGNKDGKRINQELDSKDKEIERSEQESLDASKHHNEDSDKLTLSKNVIQLQEYYRNQTSESNDEMEGKVFIDGGKVGKPDSDNANTNCINSENDVGGDMSKQINGSSNEQSVALLRSECSSKVQGGKEHGDNKLSTDPFEMRPRTVSVSSNRGTEDIALALDRGDGDEDLDTTQTSCWARYRFLRSWTFRMVLLYGSLGAVNSYVNNYVPTITVSQGATLEETAVLLTMMGVLDLLSRLGVGFFADTHFLKPSQIVAISHIILGVTCHLTQLFTTFSTMVVMATLFGLTMGTRVGLMPVLCMEAVGVDLMPEALSFLALTATLTGALMNPSLGAVAEHFGNFVPVLHIAGFLLILSASILLMLPLFRRIDKKREKKSME